MDMLTMMLKGMGVDPAALMGQAASLGAAFEAMARQQGEILEALATLQAGQDALAGAMGVYVAPPTPRLLTLIEEGSARFTDDPAAILEAARQAGGVIAAPMAARR